MGFPSARVTASRLTMGALMACMASFASAQEESTNQVAAKTAWSVFEDSDPRECWAVSSPTKVVNTKDGRVVSVRRGDTLLMTFYRPDAQVDGQVTFTGGYPFSDGSTVTLTVGDDTFELFTEGEWAWPASTAEDAKIIAALKRGTEATATGLSSRGTTTEDTFSLLGFTAAVEEAEKRCQ
jgi:hypothetical protein